jgi:hypothetical protein
MVILAGARDQDGFWEHLLALGCYAMAVVPEEKMPLETVIDIYTKLFGEKIGVKMGEMIAREI